jgi:hypothetical protein
MGRYWNGWRAATRSSLERVQAAIDSCQDEVQLIELKLKRARLQAQLQSITDQTERY